MSSSSNRSKISLIVCTRNRGDNAARAARAVLGSSYENLELILVDQSDDEVTRESVGLLTETESRLRYMALRGGGKPVALNAALQVASGDFVFLTDDDCEPQAGWENAMLSALKNPRVGCAFGVVAAAPHDASLGYITTHLVEESRVVRKLRDIRKIPGRLTTGMGACMAIRREALERIGGWDPCIGPGSVYWGGDDHDIAQRLNLAGYAVAFCSEAAVTHYGFRKTAEAYNDYMRSGYGRGAAFMKYLRMGIIHWDAIRVYNWFLHESKDHARRKLQTPHGTFVEYFRRGAKTARRHPIDAKNRCFLPLPEAQTSEHKNRFANVFLRSELEMGREREIK